MLTAAQVTKRTGERDEPIIGLPPRPAEKLPPLPPQPLVSIVVPCRNPGSMLDLALHSLFMQDYPALEIIVVDAASTDGTPRRLQQISRPGFRFLSEPDKGQADALDKGFALAKGEILAWLNADDCLLPHAVSTWVALLQHQSAPALVYGGCFEWFADVGWMVPAPWIIPPDYQILRDRSDYIMQPAAAFRADAYHKVGGINPDLHYTMDWDLWLSLAESWPCGYREQVLAANRVHEATKTNTGGLARIREIRQVGRRHGRSRFSSANHRYSLVELSTRSAAVGWLRSGYRNLRSRVKNDNNPADLARLPDKTVRNLPLDRPRTLWTINHPNADRLEIQIQGEPFGRYTVRVDGRPCEVERRGDSYVADVPREQAICRRLDLPEMRGIRLLRVRLSTDAELNV